MTNKLYFTSFSASVFVRKDRLNLEFYAAIIHNNQIDI